jgi:N-acetylneuraminate synthase
MRVTVIAEAGVNHNGSLSRALDLVDIACDAGADVVKFQTFRSEKLVSRTATKAEYQRVTTGTAESQFEMLKKLELSAGDHRKILERCRTRGIEFMSSPFDEESLTFLVRELAVARLKLGSGEITNAPLLLTAARSGRAVILSTGMSTLIDVERALGVLAFGYTSSAKPSLLAFAEAFASTAGQAALQRNVTLLHCTTEYPARFDEVNLRAMDTMRTAFALPVGFSDHTPGIAMPIAAAARHAVIIEKHFTTDKHLPGPDHRASLAPDELREMVAAVRAVESAIGSGVKIPAPSELQNIPVARRSLTTLAAVRAGQPFTTENLGVKRPGTGRSPYELWDWLGRPAERDFDSDETIS